MADTKTVITSGIFKLNLRDLAKGAAVAVLSATITVVQNSIANGSLDFDWKNIAIVSISALAAYLLKNLLTPAQEVTTIAKPPADPGA